MISGDVAAMPLLAGLVLILSGLQGIGLMGRYKTLEA